MRVSATLNLGCEALTTLVTHTRCAKQNPSIIPPAPGHRFVLFHLFLQHSYTPEMFCLTSAATPDPAVTPQMTPLVTSLHVLLPSPGFCSFSGRWCTKGTRAQGSGGQREPQYLNSFEPRQQQSQGAKGPTESIIVEEEEAVIVL